jgi:hypothetical protein
MKTIKRVINCVDCSNILPKNNKHHFRCEKCYFEWDALRNNGHPKKEWIKKKDMFNPNNKRTEGKK